MSHHYPFRILSALTVASGMISFAGAQSAPPTCGADGTASRVEADSCTCVDQTRVGDDRAKPCLDAAPVSAPPAAAKNLKSQTAAAARVSALVGSAGHGAEFGPLALSIDGGWINGADGHGTAGAAAVTFARFKTKAGTVDLAAGGGHEKMRGIPIDNVTNTVVPIGAAPDGTPINANVTAVTTGFSPAVVYVPIFTGTYKPPVKGRLVPYVGGQAGVTYLTSTNAAVNTNVTATVDGQTVYQQSMASLQPTGEAKNHAGGGLIGGVAYKLTKSIGVHFQALIVPASGSYDSYTTGVDINLRPK
jgi:hypothetical protein